MPRKQMTVRMTTGAAGTNEDGSPYAFSPGEERTCPTDEAKRLLESGQAEPVAAKPTGRAERRVKQPAGVETR